MVREPDSGHQDSFGKDQVIFELEETCLDDTVRYKTTIPVVWFYTALLDDNVWEGEEFYVSRKTAKPG